MTEVKDSSSLPLLLSITGAVLAVVIGGWFFLNRQEAVPETETEAPPTYAVASVETAPLEDPATKIATVLEADIPAPAEDGSAPNVDADLRKARLAADADILVMPTSQSALHYYGLVLKADPRNSVAIAELDAILARVATTVMEHLDNEDYDSAYEISALVAEVSPEHELVLETQRILDEHTEQLVEQAIQHAQDGKDNQATEMLATVERLPGRNPDYIGAVSDSIDEIREVRVAAERDRAERARLAAGEARAAWADRVHTAIAAGNLLTPAGASARDLLTETNAWSDEREILTGEFVAALLDSAGERIAENELLAAEGLLKAVEDFDNEAEGLNDLRASLENALIDERSNRVISTKELVYVRTVPPRYPRRASERNISGWVVVDFIVTPEGGTTDVEVREAEPEQVFDKAATRAVEQWQFEPVEFRGQVISQRAAARLVFNIE